MQEFLTDYHLPWLLKASWQAAVLILLVLVVQWAVGRRLNPRWRYGLWLLVVARLALPWTIPSSVSVFNLLSYSQGGRRRSLACELPRNCRGFTAPEAAVMPVAQPRDTAAGTPAATPPGFHLGVSHLLLAWAVGAFALAVYLVIAHYRLWRRITPRRPLIDARVLNLLEDCKQAMGLRVPVTLVETPAVGSPSLFGFVRPRLLLPVGLTRDFSQEELRYVFLHELSHIKRHDILTGWLMTALANTALVQSAGVAGVPPHASGSGAGVRRAGALLREGGGEPAVRTHHHQTIGELWPLGLGAEHGWNRREQEPNERKDQYDRKIQKNEPGARTSGRTVYRARVGDADGRADGRETAR